MADALWACSSCGKGNMQEADNLDTATIMEAVSDINSSEVMVTVKCSYCGYEENTLVEVSVE